MTRTGLAILIVLFLVTSSEATEISARVASTEVFLDETLVVEVTVTNPTQATTPIPGATQDFEIKLSGSPSRESQVSIVNGNMTQTTTMKYRYHLVPKRLGRLTVPRFILKDGGRNYRTKPIRVRVVPSQGGLSKLMCEITVDRTTVYVGEAVNLKLDVWVQRYFQRDIGSLNEQTMFKLRDTTNSDFGIFENASVQGGPSVRRTKRRDGQGKSQEYYVYTWEQTVYPKVPGHFDFGEIRIGWQYPSRLRRGFGIFGGIEHASPPRNLRALAETPNLQIQALPLDGRPADFNGAIGRFTFATRAAPRKASVGDPITLTMVLQSNGDMERVSAPRLDQVKGLTDNFEVSGESLTDEVQFGRKIFSLTIRALREDVAEIPALPMSYFDPARGKYDTTWSKPIALNISKAKRVAPTVNPDLPAGSTGSLTPIEEVTEGLQANTTQIDLLLADQSGGFQPAAIVVLAGLPPLYLVAWLFCRRSERFREDVAFRRRRRAYRDARKSLSAAGRSNADGVSGALLGYIADRCNVPAAGLTRRDAEQLLRERSVPDAVNASINNLLESIEQARYAGGADQSNEEIITRARSILDELERSDLR